MTKYNQEGDVALDLKSWGSLTEEILRDLEQSQDPLKLEDLFDRLPIKCNDEFCPTQSIEKKYRKNHLSGDEYYPGHCF